MKSEAKGQGKFIGFIESNDDGLRASFRTLLPGAIFSEEGHSSEVFDKDKYVQAVKWLHIQARSMGFSSIVIRKKNEISNKTTPLDLR